MKNSYGPQDGRDPAIPPSFAAPSGRLSRGRVPFALIVGLAALLIVLLWSAILLRAEREHEQVGETVRRDTMNLARAFEEHATRLLRSADQSASFLKFEYEKGGERIDIDSYVLKGMVGGPPFNDLGVIDEHGILRHSSLPTANAVDLSDQEYFRVHAAHDTNSLHVGKPLPGRAPGKWSLPLTRRIAKADGSFGGVVLISLDPFSFTRLFRDVDLGREGVVTLVGLDGVVRARRSGERMDVGQNVAASQLFELLRSRSEGGYRAASQVDGVERIYSYRKLRDLPLAVVVGVSEKEAMTAFVARRQGALELAGALTLVIVALAVGAMGLLRRQQDAAAALRRARDEIAAANRLKSDYLISMAEELRTPLNAICGYAEYLRETARDETSRDFARIIQGSGQHLLQVVSAVLDLARIEAGVLELRPDDEDLPGLMADLCTTHRPLAVSRGLRLDCEFKPDARRVIRCDRARVVQVLDILLRNAIESTEAGFVRITARLSGDDCAFDIEDSRTGVLPLKHAAIFGGAQPAGRLEMQQHDGTGLGLVLCRELAAAMDGGISQQSMPGKGNIFTLSLPLAGRRAGRTMH